MSLNFCHYLYYHYYYYNHYFLFGPFIMLSLCPSRQTSFLRSCLNASRTVSTSAVGDSKCLRMIFPSQKCLSVYSKVPPLRNCIIRNSGLILVNKIPVYKKLSRLIHVQFLLEWYIVIFYGIYLNMAPISLSSLEIRMKV